jgi:hypothetical protein
MNQLNELLKRGSPLNAESPLDLDEVRQMRRVVLNAPSSDAIRRWPMLLGVAAFGAAVAMVVFLVPHSARQAAERAPSVMPEVRSLQFSTPGGTRVFWTLHTNSDLR